MRRLEQDARDGHYGKALAEAAGVTPEQAYAVLTAFFSDTAHPYRWLMDYAPREPDGGEA